MSEKLKKGSYTAINQCIQLTPEEKIVIITDLETKEVGDSLEEEAQKVTSDVKKILIEDYIDRPAKELPQKMLDEIKSFQPDVSVYAAQGYAGEYPVFRSPLIDFLTQKLECRHAHMISITKQLMEDGMNKDFEQIFRVTNKVLEIVTPATKIHVTDPYGTDIIFELDPENLKWVPDNGRIRKKDYTNLPGGEVFGTVTNANGVFVAWVIGDHLAQYGELSEPLKVTIKDSKVVKTEGPTEIKDEFDKYIMQAENSDRVGELGIGTLIGLEGFVGNLLQDEKFPGVHIAFGHPFPKKTGATWDAPSHIDIIAKQTSILVKTTTQEKVLMEKGKFIDEILGA